MARQEDQQKNALCDLLMREGIAGCPDEEAISRVCTLTANALDLGRKDCLARAIIWHDALEARGITGEPAIILDTNRANAIAGSRYGTAWRWEQPTLAQELFYLRRAISHPDFLQASAITRCKCLNNLGSRLRVAGRAIEALEYWHRTLAVQQNFGMALCNRAAIFADYGAALDDPTEAGLFRWCAHNEASAALAPTAIYTDGRDERTKQHIGKLKDWIESVIDVPGISALDPLSYEDTSTTNSERSYRRWCLENCLFLNPLNDLGPHMIATADTIALAQHVVRVDSPHRFASFFDQMKQEYVSARWLLHEGSNSTSAHFSDRDVYIGATDPRPLVSLGIEKVKGSYRSAYSLFDKIAFFLAAYMELGIQEDQISFRTVWRFAANKPIRKEFEATGNWPFCALFWLAKDFFERENDEVAEPQARSLNLIRNCIEHRYLRVTATNSPSPPPADLAVTVSREQLLAKTIHLLKLARSALIYLALGVGFEERRRAPEHAKMDIDDLHSTQYMADDEKM